MNDITRVHYEFVMDVTKSRYRISDRVFVTLQGPLIIHSRFVSSTQIYLSKHAKPV